MFIKENTINKKDRLSEFHTRNTINQDFLKKNLKIKKKIVSLYKILNYII